MMNDKWKTQKERMDESWKYNIEHRENSKNEKCVKRFARKSSANLSKMIHKNNYLEMLSRFRQKLHKKIIIYTSIIAYSGINFNRIRCISFQVHWNNNSNSTTTEHLSVLVEHLIIWSFGVTATYLFSNIKYCIHCKSTNISRTSPSETDGKKYPTVPFLL